MIFLNRLSIINETSHKFSDKPGQEFAIQKNFNSEKLVYSKVIKVDQMQFKSLKFSLPSWWTKKTKADDQDKFQCRRSLENIRWAPFNFLDSKTLLAFWWGHTSNILWSNQWFRSWKFPVLVHWLWSKSLVLKESFQSQ